MDDYFYIHPPPPADVDGSFLKVHPMKKVALFGAGRIGRIHATNLCTLPGVELVAVSDPVASSCAPAIAQAGDLDCTAVTIKTRKGRLCQINTTRRAAYGYDQRFEVMGSAGMLQCGNHRPSEVTQADAQGTRVDNPEAFFLQRYADAYRLEIEHFFEQLQTGGVFRTTIEDGVRAQVLADAAAQSAASGQAVEF